MMHRIVESTHFIVMAGLDPAIHEIKAWMPGQEPVLGPREARTRGPGMTLGGMRE
jgi:hypothetical protein